MKTSLRLALVVIPLAAAGAAFAQTSSTTTTTQSGPRRGGHGPRGNPIIRAIDTDRNHEISAAELANAAIGIRALDLNADGSVTADELRPARPADAPERPAPPADAPAHARPTDPVMLALDANSDGTLNATEITNAATSLAALDANKDGKLTIDEIRPLPPEGAATGAGPQGPRGPRT
jgi:hypothetical protein